MSNDSPPTTGSLSVPRARSLALRPSNALVTRGLRDIAQFGNRARAEELVILGDAYRKKSDYDKAIWYYTRAIEVDPEYGIAYFQRGYTNARWFSRRDAIADYTEFIRLDPNDAEAYFNRGYNYEMWMGNDMSLAIADYTEAIRLDPQMVHAYYRRAEAYRRKKGDYDRAIADFTEVIRLDPKNSFAYHGRGLAYQKKGDLKKAQSDFAEAERLWAEDEEMRP
ncbi:MAG: tetratricopeptide repeat protein [Candidatus Anammoximicrobium sp.]|nr:tetratricopeptide repeat protein [Candidatus Anammoximicrobium sp.]